tara:strand:- start:638 stop:757 length:120 start_codon:yes stop_codon:yes gene_type:complete
MLLNILIVEEYLAGNDGHGNQRTIIQKYLSENVGDWKLR